MFEPTRLILARRRRGWSRQELARQSGIKARTLDSYERGERVPSDENLAILARVLGFPEKFFSQPEVAPLPENAVSFRALSRMSAASRDRALSCGDLAQDLSRWVEQRFQLPEVDLPDLAECDPEVAAETLRVQWGLADRSIADVVKLLESKGVRVFSLAEDDLALDAFSFWVDGRPFILLNTQKSAERSRFDAAHELGHLVLHRQGANKGRDAEYEANDFASAFLMPKSSVLVYAPRFPALPALVRAKHTWGVSVLALIVRLHSLGRLSEWQYRSLCIQAQTHGYREKEPEPASREMSHIWPRVFDGLRAEGVSRRQIASELGWPSAELQALVFQLILTSESGAVNNASPVPVLSGSPALRLVP